MQNQTIINKNTHISKWFCNVISLKHYDVLNVYGLCNNGRLTDIGNRELLWENMEVLA